MRTLLLFCLFALFLFLAYLVYESPHNDPAFYGMCFCLFSMLFTSWPIKGHDHS